MVFSAEYFIEKLKLESHIEGGYFKEIYKNNHKIIESNIDVRFVGNRALTTTIYFLLKSGQVSKFHKLKFDEIWFYHYGCPMVVHMIDEKGDYKSEIVGLDIESGQLPQILVPANTIFGSEPYKKGDFSLVSCMVSPGFDYRDFVLFNEVELSNMYPQHKAIISKLNG